MSAPVAASTSDRGCCAADCLRSEHRQQLSPTSQVPDDCCDLMETWSSFEFPTCGRSEDIQCSGHQRTHQDTISPLAGFPRLSEPQDFQASLPLHLRSCAGAC